ncbi:S8 family serine peptidase [Streptantibioticus silvisoli]|uniref:S8 family serine peptidase n=1 Tax=Streptantibioticus silvisoli TaxID=2705255 RepID=A0ABT6W3L6_9ACTN|nr:S8 family serine peptidase [Streptantibioticus silvisoli]MDI5965337.1 S8 family serine peptidase [Streptantibioticus silvisoli]
MRRIRFTFPRRTAAAGAALAAALGTGFAAAPAAHAEDIRARQWYLDPMQASAMLKVATGAGITVAVVDTGVNAQQPELRGKVLPGKVFGRSGDGRTDPDGHGTTMAMLIAGDGLGGSGVQGLAPGARILPVVNPTEGQMAEAIRYAVDHGAKVINVSEAISPLALPSELAPIASAVKYADEHGDLVFAGVGNDGKKGAPVSYPAATEGAVGVTALDQKGDVASLASYGPQVALAAPGVALPGHCIKSLGHSEGYCLVDGTSGATALASASAALIWSAHPHWTGNQVLRVMIDTASRPTTGKVPSDYLGYGGVRPRLALLGAHVDPGPANVSPLYPDLFAKPSAKPSAPASAAPSHSASSGAGSAAGTSDNSSSGSGPLWIAVGAAAVVVIAAAVGLLTVRRRHAAPPTPPPTANGPTAYGQFPYGTPPTGYGPPSGGSVPPPGGTPPPYGPPSDR